MKVLITGGSGLIGGAITKQLNSSGHEVIHLSRAPQNEGQVRQYKWDINQGYIDPQALDGTNAIINLAGASLNHRWTAAYKSSILRSRVDGTRLLYKALQENQHKVECLISASAGGYYPSVLGKYFTEADPPGSDFMSVVCQKWESEAQNIEKLGIRTVRARIGIVLSKEDGILPELMRPIKFGLGAGLGSGKQLLTWIHIHDIARMFQHALENQKMQGPYNFAGPETLTNEEITKALAQAMGKPMFLPNVPAFALKLVLGEMAATALRSNGLNTQKIQDSGFRFKYTEIDDALQDLLK